MTLALRELYPETPRCNIVLFDLRIPGAAEELHHARAVWQQDSDIETLDEDHFVLVLRPGGAARRLAS
jgi:hypothetical protein